MQHPDRPHVSRVNQRLPRGFSLPTLFLAAFLPTQVQAVDVVALENPLDFDTIPELLLAILNVIIVIAVPIIVFFIIYAGFLYVTARGNAEQTRTATRALTYAVIGGVIILGAVAIAE
ncbi:MAG: hypothetical protein GVY29_05245, partial [Spirochaetes bacterium]|nr:hypothetical protein [Spirochaetota bacterium]